MKNDPRQGVETAAITQWLVAKEERQIKGRWSKPTLILLSVVSTGLSVFVAVVGLHHGWIKFSGFECGIFLLAILIYELGHLVAARWAGYRNLKLFLVPLIGGGIHGDYEHVPLWKQVLVILAGPVPGIVIGGVAALFFLQTEASYLKVVVFMFGLINLLNLIPVGSLDGGKLLELTLFRKAWWLEFAFCGLSALLLAGLAWIVAPDWVACSLCVILSVVSGGRAIFSTLTPRIAMHLRRADFGPIPEKASELSGEQITAISHELQRTLGNDIRVDDLSDWILKTHSRMRERHLAGTQSLAFVAIHLLSVLVAIWYLFAVRNA